MSGIRPNTDIRHKDISYNHKGNLQIRRSEKGLATREAVINVVTNEIVQQSKKENVFNKSQFIEVKDMSSKTHTHEEVVSSYEKAVKKAFKEDISYFLPLHFFIPNPKSKK